MCCFLKLPLATDYHFSSKFLPQHPTFWPVSSFAPFITFSRVIFFLKCNCDHVILLLKIYLWLSSLYSSTTISWNLVFSPLLHKYSTYNLTAFIQHLKIASFLFLLHFKFSNFVHSFDNTLSISLCLAQVMPSHIPQWQWHGIHPNLYHSSLLVYVLLSHWIISFTGWDPLSFSFTVCIQCSAQVLYVYKVA